MAHFCNWQILIWRISRHVSLSMRTVYENGGFNFGERLKKITKFAKINSLQNYPLYGTMPAQIGMSRSIVHNYFAKLLSQPAAAV